MDTNSDNNKKLFDPKEYNSMILGQEKKSASQAKTMTLILTLLTDRENKEVREETLRLLKKKPGVLELLIEAIEETKKEEHRAELISACWESGIDCRSKLNYFVNLAASSGYQCCIEAISVIDGMDTPVDQDELEKAMGQLSTHIKEKTDKLKNKETIRSRAEDDTTALLAQLAELLQTLKE